MEVLRCTYGRQAGVARILPLARKIGSIPKEATRLDIDACLYRKAGEDNVTRGLNHRGSNGSTPLYLCPIIHSDKPSSSNVPLFYVSRVPIRIRISMLRLPLTMDLATWNFCQNDR